MRQTRKFATAALAVLATGVTTAALAYGPGWGNGPGAMGGGCAGQGRAAMMQADPAARIDNRLAFLKSELKITSEQEQAWQSFAETVKAQGAGMPRMGRNMTTSGTAPEQIDQRIAFMQLRLERMRTVSKAMQDLYGALTPEQQAVADRLLSRPNI